MASVALALGACTGPHISPLAPPPYRGEIPAGYDRTWTALVKALARENLPLRAIARDSGVIASDDTITPIGLWADCGTLGDDRVEGEAIVSFTVFVEADGASSTRLQVNSKMRTQAHRKGSSGKLKALPVYPCASTGRFEANLLETVRDLVRE
ncbi:MAG TPA: hypothetical protein VFJ24_06660 [Gaiellales bacterium]|nr:hypothetical protein [Gaiellales bacterium]